MSSPPHEPMRVLRNPAAQPVADVTVAGRAALDFHRGLAGYEPTPLRSLRELALQLGVARVWAKDETSRLGLPAFKVLGASWALEQALARHPAAQTVVAATDGNHGRAVAHMARRRGLDAHILVPDDMAAARREAIAGEGASVEVVTGSYDDAVVRSATLAGPTCAVVSDTAWPGYEAIPNAVIDGYSTMLWEIDEQLADAGAPPPDVVLVPVGVGALATAVVRRARGPGGWGARVVSVEPSMAACALASAQAGRPTEVPPPHRSVMSGLNCGRISPLAWPALRTGVDLFVAVPDSTALEGVRRLGDAGITAGECSGASVGALMAIVQPDEPWRGELGLGPDASVLVLLTEGPTGEPEAP